MVLLKHHSVKNFLIDQVWLQDQSIHSDDMKDGFRLLIEQHVMHLQPIKQFSLHIRFSILASEEKAIPAMKSGDVLRINCLRIEKTSSVYDGRVYRYTVLLLMFLMHFYLKKLVVNFSKGTFIGKVWNSLGPDPDQMAKMVWNISGIGHYVRFPYKNLIELTLMRVQKLVRKRSGFCIKTPNFVIVAVRHRCHDPER